MEMRSDPHKTKCMKNRRSTIEAVAAYIALSNRVANPEGSFDKQKRWYPDARCSCCATIRSPSKSWPYSLLVHCRTSEHIYNSYSLSCTLDEFKKLCRAGNKSYRSAGPPSPGTTVANLLNLVATDVTLGLFPHYAVEAVLVA
jgi:hypothetical protein